MNESNSEIIGFVSDWQNSMFNALLRADCNFGYIIETSFDLSQKASQNLRKPSKATHGSKLGHFRKCSEINRETYVCMF